MSIYVYFWLMLCIGFGLGMTTAGFIAGHRHPWFLLLLQVPVATFVVAMWFILGVKL